MVEDLVEDLVEDVVEDLVEILFEDLSADSGVRASFVDRVERLFEGEGDRERESLAFVNLVDRPLSDGEGSLVDLVERPLSDSDVSLVDLVDLVERLLMEESLVDLTEGEAERERRSDRDFSLKVKMTNQIDP